MRRWIKLLALALIAGGLSGCWARQSDLDALRADHDQLRGAFNHLRDSLKVHAQKTYDWENRTFQTICDVAKVNKPLTSYSTATQEYCGDTEGGAPPPPPDWGTD